MVQIRAAESVNSHTDEIENPWFVLQVKPKGAARAISNLKRQNIGVFAPMNVATNTATKLPSLLFPGYLFVSFDPGITSFTSVNSTFGVSRLVLSGVGSTTGLPIELISGLKQRCDGDGFLKPLEDLKPNERVQILSGPFKDFLCTVEKYNAKDRVSVLFELMGQATRLEIAPGILQRAREE